MPLTETLENRAHPEGVARARVAEWAHIWGLWKSGDALRGEAGLETCRAVEAGIVDDGGTGQPFGKKNRTCFCSQINSV